MPRRCKPARARREGRSARDPPIWGNHERVRSTGTSRYLNTRSTRALRMRSHSTRLSTSSSLSLPELAATPILASQLLLLLHPREEQHANQLIARQSITHAESARGSKVQKGQLDSDPIPVSVFVHLHREHCFIVKRRTRIKRAGGQFWVFSLQPQEGRGSSRGTGEDASILQAHSHQRSLTRDLKEASHPSSRRGQETGTRTGQIGCLVRASLDLLAGELHVLLVLFCKRYHRL